MDFDNEQAKINVIQQCFKNNFSYTEIIYFLERFYGFEITVRHLHRILRKNDLSRRKDKTCLNLVMRFFRKQLEVTLSLIGYRYMHLKARAAGLVVDRETIRLVIRAMDPEVSLRPTHKLRF